MKNSRSLRARVFMGILAASLGLSLAPKKGMAESSSFMETMGISIAMGTVLGASTLPFYERADENLINLAWGAAAGLVVGLGVYAFMAMSNSGDQAFYSFLEQNSKNSLNHLRSSWVVRSRPQSFGFSNLSLASAQRSRFRVMFPLVSLSW